jgi:hypothetical protein
MAKTPWQEFSKGIIKENPVLRLVLGTCATLALSTSASNAIGMGLATTFVLVCSNTVISLLRKVIPDKVRIPCYITLIAGFVTIVQMLVEAYSPSLKAALGIFLPLIVVNCIILGRAEMFANKNNVLPSISRRSWHGRRIYRDPVGYGYYPGTPRRGNRLWISDYSGIHVPHYHLSAPSGRFLRFRHADCPCKQTRCRQGGGAGGARLPKLPALRKLLQAGGKRKGGC